MTIVDLSEESCARIRDGLAEARAKRQPGPHGLVIVNTGDGKGKTTAALGILLRAAGQNMRVVMVQFMKASTGNWGEIRAAKRLGIDITPIGDGFTWTSKDLEKGRSLVQFAWETSCQIIENNQHDIVILDEITYPLTYGWLDLGEVLSVLRNRNPLMHIIVTGRNAPTGLMDFADLVTEMRMVKHPYNVGILAQKGIDF